MNPKTLRELAADVLRGWQKARIVTGNQIRAHADAWENERAEAIELISYIVDVQGDMTPDQWHERCEQWLAEAKDE